MTGPSTMPPMFATPLIKLVTEPPLPLPALSPMVMATDPDKMESGPQFAAPATRRQMQLTTTPYLHGELYLLISYMTHI